MCSLAFLVLVPIYHVCLAKVGRGEGGINFLVATYAIPGVYKLSKRKPRSVGRGGYKEKTFPLKCFEVSNHVIYFPPLTRI